MRDVAALAGVSIKTVSRVINGEAGVASEMSARVTNAITMLGYQHDVGASALRRRDRRTATIGMILEDLANPYSSAVQRAVEDIAREHGVLVLAASTDEDGVREHGVLTALTGRRVDALVVMPTAFDQRAVLDERRAGTVVVFIDRIPPFADADVVVVDNLEGTRRGVGHLVAHGHRRIGFVGDLPSISTAVLRLQGYRDELAAHGIAVDEAIVATGRRTAGEADAAITAMLALPDPPTAFFCARNTATLGAIHALRRAGLHHEVALVGFDDIPMADLLDPAITVVAQDPSAIGRAAAEVIFRRLGGDVSPPSASVIATTLVVRGSGEIPPRMR